MKNKSFLLFALCFLFWGYSINAQSTPQQMVVKMGTGINLGNILSASYEGNWASPLTEGYIDNVHRLGFKTVRIPIRFDKQTTPLSSVDYTDADGNYIGSPSDYTVNESYLDRIDEILGWCQSRNMIAIVDVHGDHWFWGSFDPLNKEDYKTGNDRLAAIDRFKAIWTAISTRFQNKSEDVLFEIMNEPFFSMNASDVISINTQMLNIIRKTNPTRNVIVTGGGANSYNAPLQLSDTFLQSDSHLIATFHYYQPFSFTSSSQQKYNDFDWGSLSDMQSVNNDFDAVKNWATQRNVAVFLGEFGADNEGGYIYSTSTYGAYGGPDAASRKKYHEFVANAARTRGFAFAAWDAGEKSGKTIYLDASKTWIKDVRNAVLGSSCINQAFISNSDIGCNYDYDWGLNLTSATATLNNAKEVDRYQGATLNLNVETSGGVFNNVVLSNTEAASGFVAGKTYNISFYGKGDNNQQFRIRMKSMVNGVASYSYSAVNTLSSNFAKYTYSYTVPENSTSVQFQLLCGKNTGDYYFDEFKANIDTSVCQSQYFVSNPNVECGADYKWSLDLPAGSATLSNASQTNSYQGSTLQLNVANSNAVFANVAVLNEEITSGFTPGEAYTINFYAKGSNNQQVKIRMKSVVNGVTSYAYSAAYTLTSSFSRYSYTYTVPTNATSLQFQILCGKNTGDYFFDEFTVSTGASSSRIAGAEVKNTPVETTVYPNPVSNFFEIKSSEDVISVEVYSANGAKVSCKNVGEKYDVSSLPDGVYIIKINTKSGSETKKILVKH